MVLMGLVGYLLHDFVEHRKTQVELLNPNVRSEGIAAYQARADSLRVLADSLRGRLERAGLLTRPSVKALAIDTLLAGER